MVIVRKSRQMNVKRSQAESRKVQKKAVVRASITFPPNLYESLEEIAKRKKVSLAWVVREASENYVVAEGSTEVPQLRSGKRR